MNLSTTIKRQYFDAIWKRRKTDEYRADTPYWRKRIEGRIIDRITFICGRETMRVGVLFWSKIETPADLRHVVTTPMCFRLALDMPSIVLTVPK
jgi:hypothetical protein